MRRSYVDIREGQMHYRHVGSGQPIVLLHMSGSSSDEFEKVGGFLGSKLSVYAPDLLGYGGSDAPPRYYSLKDHAETVIRFMDALNVEKAIIAGNLAGANIAARLAVQWPKRVCGLMLSNLVYYTEYADFKSARNRPIFQEVELSPDGSHLMEYWKRAAQYGEAVEYANARAVCLHQSGKYGETLHWALFEDDDFAEILPKVKTPTVVVALEKTPLAAIQPKVAALIQGAKSEMIRDATPYVARTKPKEFAQVILDYFT